MHAGGAQLTPLATALKELLAITPQGSTVDVRVNGTTDAYIGHVVARSISATVACPTTAIALREGFAVCAQETVGATSYAPAYLFDAPTRVKIGGSLPEGTDAVLPLAVVAIDRKPTEILGSVAPGENIRRAGGDFPAGGIIRAAGERLRATDIALLREQGIADISLVAGHVAIAVPETPASATIAADWLKASIRAFGANPSIVPADALAEELAQQKPDLVLILGSGQSDADELVANGVHILANGLAMTACESAGCGYFEKGGAKTPVILMPNRMEQLVVAWLVLVRPCLDRSLGVTEPRARAAFPLSRKIVSAPGYVDLVLLRRSSDGRNSLWEPLATGDTPWHVLVRAEAYMLIAADSEGMPAGAIVSAEYL